MSDREAGEPPVRRDLKARSFQELMGVNLTTLVAEAAAAAPLAEEVGMLRVALARLLVEEDDSSRLAANMAKVAAVAVQAARVRGALSAREQDEATDEAAAVRSTLVLLGKGELAFEPAADLADE